MSAAGTPGADEPAQARKAFDELLGRLRPKLHRYCARMTGSVVDGEDVVQEALVKAIGAFAPSFAEAGQPGEGGAIANPESWLFRIAHNAALDFLRRRARHEAVRADEDPDMIADAASEVERRQAAAASLRTFMRLTVAQRSSVILMDVLGYSLEEIGGVTGSSIASIKAALHRGRTRLRELAHEPEEVPPPVLAQVDRARLAAYVDRFNARDFAAVRDMLAEEVQLELVNRTRAAGRSEVGRYFHNYSLARDWQLVPGLADGRPAALVRDAADPSGAPAYFVLLQWSGDGVAAIRDFRYARYAMDGAELVALG
jgi:RNA polymerase sigma-70 factor, ECF subfamily